MTKVIKTQKENESKWNLIDYTAKTHKFFKIIFKLKFTASHSCAVALTKLNLNITLT